MTVATLLQRFVRLTDQGRRVPGWALRKARSQLTVSPGMEPPSEKITVREQIKARDRREWRRVAEVLDPTIDEDQDRQILADAGLFDEAWYRQEYGHLLSPDDDPLSHYVSIGFRRGLAPNRQVDIDEVQARIGPSAREPLAQLVRLRRAFDLNEVQQRLTEDRPSGVPLDDVELRWRDVIEGRVSNDDSFVLYRIIGNDLPPRHRSGQSERNLRFLLDNEPELEGCAKRFVLNRIVDRRVEERLMGLLDAHGAPYLHLPFDADEYRAIGWRVSDFEQPGMLYGWAHDRLADASRARAIDHAFHDKNLYVMNNNGARNAALEDGRARARWVLPLDGNCFFTRSAWRLLRNDVLTRPHRRYIVIPMARVNDNAELLADDVPSPANDEPQVGFRQDATETFDDDARYGRRPKVELLRRLGVAGPWDSWPDEPWEQPFRGRCREAGEYQIAGWVARLASGQPNLEVDGRQRMISRMVGIRRLLSEVQESTLRASFDADEPVWLSKTILEQQRSDGQVAGKLIVDLVQQELRCWVDDSRSLPLPRRISQLTQATIVCVLGGWLDHSDELMERGVEGLERLTTGRDWRGEADPWDLAGMLDAVRLLTGHGLLDRATQEGFVERVRRHRRHLLDSLAGTRRRHSLGPIGTWHEVELAACNAYLDDADGLVDGSRRIAGRFHDQFELLPKVGSRWRRRIADTSNLFAWSRLLSLHRRLGIALCDDGSQAAMNHRRVAQNLVERSVPSEVHAPLAAHLASAGTTVPPAARPAELHLPPGKGVAGVSPMWWAGIRLPPMSEGGVPSTVQRDR